MLIPLECQANGKPIHPDMTHEQLPRSHRWLLLVYGNGICEQHKLELADSLIRDLPHTIYNRLPPQASLTAKREAIHEYFSNPIRIRLEEQGNARNPQYEWMQQTLKEIHEGYQFLIRWNTEIPKV